MGFDYYYFRRCLQNFSFRFCGFCLHTILLRCGAFKWWKKHLLINNFPFSFPFFLFLVLFLFVFFSLVFSFVFVKWPMPLLLQIKIYLLELLCKLCMLAHVSIYTAVYIVFNMQTFCHVIYFRSGSYDRGGKTVANRFSLSFYI